MTNEYSKTILLDEIVDGITALENDNPGPGEPECSTRAPVKRGLSTLLKIQKAIMEENLVSKNSIKVGNITITGTLSIVIVVVGYILLKVHGII